MVGQPAAAVTVVGAGAGVGVGAGVTLLMVTLPPVPGDAISLAPQPARASTDALAQSARPKALFFIVTISIPVLKPRNRLPDAWLASVEVAPRGGV